MYDAGGHREKAPPPTALAKRIYAMVERIPWGHVTTNAVIAHAVGVSERWHKLARPIADALSCLPADTEVAWWRVVETSGALPDGPMRSEQRRRLEDEGVTVVGDCVHDACRLLWLPPKHATFGENFVRIGEG